MRDNALTFLELVVGPFRVAILADQVRHVIADVDLDADLDDDGERLRLVDLHALFLKATRPRAPFAVVLQTERTRIAVAVDRLVHLRLPDPAPIAVPRLGLRAPALFPNAERDAKGVLLLLDVDQLAAAAAPTKNAV
ncbi:MAG: chemotaxis protein CheW [Deltaproteobacteria bacterium]|nr:chemotaxis protein CheW [Deltaproteobacteria bacterium]